MRAIYINLESAAERREVLVESFQTAIGASKWRLDRFNAVRPSNAAARFGGTRELSIAETGCWLSHHQVLLDFAYVPGSLLVLEDDAFFGRHSLEAIAGFVRSPDFADWDVVFTDVIVPGCQWMLELIRLKRELGPRQIRVIDLYGKPFAGATAYVVNERAKVTLAKLLDKPELRSVPYDMALRRLVNERKLRACCLFPFLTTVGEVANQSQIQDLSQTSADAIWNTFRRLIWNEARPESSRGALDLMSKRYIDSEVRGFGLVFEAMASTAFRAK